MEKIPLGILRIEGAQEERIKRMKVSEKIDDNGLVVSDKKIISMAGERKKIIIRGDNKGYFVEQSVYKYKTIWKVKLSQLVSNERLGDL